MDVNWINLAKDRNRWRTLGNRVMTFRFPFGAENFCANCRDISFSGRTQLLGIRSGRGCLRTSFSICVIFPKVVIISATFIFPVLNV